LLPDEDSSLNYASGWGCAIQSTIDVANMISTDHQLVDLACDCLDLSYQAATREAIQDAIRAGGKAIGENELTRLESALPICVSEIEYQIRLLQGFRT